MASDPAKTLPKTFDPAEIEARWYAHWEDNGLFRPHRPEAEPFTLVNPPPNVTGSLHIGHALDNTLQDVVVRYERLRGKDALWVVGTDHAGIATQMVVERNLASQGIRRTQMSREDFIAHVWEWKEQSGGTITRQLRRLGCSMDWSREQFTMDAHFSRAVVKAFVTLYNEGLIYRDKRLVNWDPALRTAISDLEVEQREVQGHFWHFRYPLESGEGYIAIATTRPETILGDGAVAVHPGDERYAHLVGQKCRLPIVDRLIPIIADEHVRMDFGSGAVKITAAHDWNDYEVYKRHPEAGIPLINLLNADATMSDACPPAYRGLDRYDARANVVADFDALGLLDKVEDHVHMVPYGDRGGVVIEPWLTDQWYVDAEKLAVAPMQAVRDGRIEIIPKSWEKTFFNWMENIQPWCVSRQLWWGHRIPAWYDKDGNVVVAESEAAAIDLSLARHSRESGNPVAPSELDPRLRGDDALELTRDPDVLDTWFSSALWPFATLGWPDDTALLQKHYPNSLLVSGFDILFFWDARMMMMGTHLTGQTPWSKLYLHGLVRAPDGQKMSKSKGNVVDPLILIDQYGADALRFFMAAMESQGRDIKIDESRIEGYRNFATKLWNAARFCQANGIGASQTLEAPPATLPVNRWIIGEVVETLAVLDKAMADLRFDAAANVIYHFTWDRFCDWYLELIKGAIDAETRAVAGWALDQILVMLHPFMPFVTEELWHAVGARSYELILARWPEPDARADPQARAEIDWLIALAGATRSARNELGIAPGARLPAFLPSPTPLARRVIERESAAIERLARLAPVELAAAPTGAAMQVTAGEDMLVVPLEDVIDLAAEKARLAKARESSHNERKSLEKRLANPSFVEKARPEAVAKARADHAHHAAEVARLEAALERLG